MKQSNKKAANFERRGQRVPEYILLSLDDLYGSLESTETLLKHREAEVKQEKARYAEELERYKQIKGLK